MSGIQSSVSSGPDRSSTSTDILPPATDTNQAKMRLTSSDGREFSVFTATAKVSRTLADMITSMGDEDAEPTAAIELPVEGDTLEAVLEWCEEHKGQPFDNSPEFDAFTHRYESLELTPWQRTFLSQHQVNLWQLAIGANYLDVSSLYFAVCYVIADVIYQEATPARIVSGEAVVRLKTVFLPRHEQPTTVKKRKALVEPPSLPFDDDVPDDILVDIFRFLTYDQLQTCCQALPRWNIVVDNKKRLMPREPLRRVTITPTGTITLVSGSYAFGPSPGRSTRSKAFKTDHRPQPPTCGFLRDITAANRREHEALADLWRYSMPDMVVPHVTDESVKLFRDYVDAEEAVAIRIKHLRIQHFDSCYDEGNLLEIFKLLGAFITKIGGVDHISFPTFGKKHAVALDARSDQQPDNVRELLKIWKRRAWY